MLGQTFWKTPRFAIACFPQEIDRLQKLAKSLDETQLFPVFFFHFHALWISVFFQGGKVDLRIETPLEATAKQLDR